MVATLPETVASLQKYGRYAPRNGRFAPRICIKTREVKKKLKKSKKKFKKKYDPNFFPLQNYFSMTFFSRNPDKKLPKTTVLLSPRGLYTINTCPEGAHGPKGPCPAGAIGTAKYPQITRYPNTILLEI